MGPRRDGVWGMARRQRLPHGRVWEIRFIAYLRLISLLQMNAENEQTPTPEYVKRFNQGYLLAQYEPDLAARLQEQKGLENTGLKAGIEQYHQEKGKDYTTPAFLRGDRLNSPDTRNREDKDKDISRE